MKVRMNRNGQTILDPANSAEFNTYVLGLTADMNSVPVWFCVNKSGSASTHILNGAGWVHRFLDGDLTHQITVKPIKS